MNPEVTTHALWFLAGAFGIGFIVGALVMLVFLTATGVIAPDTPPDDDDDSMWVRK